MEPNLRKVTEGEIPQGAEESRERVLENPCPPLGDAGGAQECLLCFPRAWGEEEEGAFLSRFLAWEQSQAWGVWGGLGYPWHPALVTSLLQDTPQGLWGHLRAAGVAPRDIGEQQW